MIDEFNVSYKNLLNWVIEPIKDQAKDSAKQIDEKFPSFLLWATNKNSLINEISTQSMKKWEQIYYNAILWQDNKKNEAGMQKVWITKVILASIRINPNYFFWDIISNILVLALTPSERIKSRYIELSELCK